MRTISKITFFATIRDPFLLLWSIIIPIAGTLGLGYFIKIEDYPKHIMIGMIGASVIFYAFMTTGFAVLAQRRRGVYNLLHVTPLSLKKYILSTSAVWTLVAVFCGLLVMAVGAVFFNINYAIMDVLLVVLVLLVVALTYVFFAFFISSLCKTESHLNMATNLIVMPMLFLSDAFYSLDRAPGFIKAISKVNPFQIFINSVRSAIDLTWNTYFVNTVILVVLLILAFLISVRTFKYNN